MTDVRRDAAVEIAADGPAGYEQGITALAVSTDRCERRHVEAALGLLRIVADQAARFQAGLDEVLEYS